MQREEEEREGDAEHDAERPEQHEDRGQEEEEEEEEMGILVGDSLPPRVVGTRSGMACLTLALVLPDNAGEGARGEDGARKQERPRYFLVSVQWWGEQTSVSFRCDASPPARSLSTERAAHHPPPASV